MSKWQKAKIKFLTEQYYDCQIIGPSSKNVQIIRPGDILTVYFELLDSYEGFRKPVKFAHIEYMDYVLLEESDYELIELGEIEDMHPTQRVLKKFAYDTEKMLVNITNG